MASGNAIDEPQGLGNAPFSLQRLVPSLTAGLVIGLLEVATAISFAALIFNGALAPFASYGIGYAIIGAIIGCTVIALFTSWPGFVGGNQDVSAAITALMVASLIGAMPASATAEHIFITAVVAIALTTMLTGLFLLATGHFDLGNLARFLPYPVIGGFLAGSGWLLITGAVSLMADVPVDLAHLPELLQRDMLARWLPGVLLAIVIMVISNRIDHYLILPGLLLLAIIAYFVVAWAAGFTTAELSAGGWLLGPFEGGSLWKPLTPGDLRGVYWPAVMSQVATIAAIGLISTASLLLNAGAVELAVDTDIDLNNELRVAGAANMLASITAGLVGFQQLSMSILNYRVRANNRFTGIVGVAVCVLALLAGASFLGLFPKMIVGALLFLLGLSFIVDWVIEGWSRLPRIDFAIVVTILLVTAFVGFLQAVTLGLVLAVVLFVVGYSRVDVVRHELTGATYQSRVVRSREEERFLRQHGEEIYILQLQGFVFFGTAETLLKLVRRRAQHAAQAPLSAVVLDLEQVSGLDTTAINRFSIMKLMAHTRNLAIVVCGANERVRTQLERGGFGKEDRAVLYFDSTDQGVAWCEERLLARRPRSKVQPETPAPAFLARELMVILAAERKIPEAEQEKQLVILEGMISYFERLDIAAGTKVISQGEKADALFLLASGQLTTGYTLPDETFVRLETVHGGGRVLGEIGFFLGGERTADVVAQKPTTLYRLTRENLARMQKENHQAASLLHRLIANILAERVVRLTDVVRILER